MKPALILSALCLALIDTDARANAVSFNFSGEFTSKEKSGFLGGGFEPGLNFAGTLTYETSEASTDLYPQYTELGLYAFPQFGRYRLEITAGGHSVMGEAGIITLQDTPGLDVIEYGTSFQRYDGIPVPPEFTVSLIGLSFRRTEAPFDALIGDQLPTAMPNFSDFNLVTIAISAQEPSGERDVLIYGRVTEVTLVPEPGSTVILFLGGTVFLACLWHRRAFGILPKAPQSPDPTSSLQVSPSASRAGRREARRLEPVDRSSQHPSRRCSRRFWRSFSTKVRRISLRLSIRMISDKLCAT